MTIVGNKPLQWPSVEGGRGETSTFLHSSDAFHKKMQVAFLQLTAQVVISTRLLAG